MEKLNNELTNNEIHQKAASSSAVDKVVRAITDAIIYGELKPGDRLAPESELAKKYNVGRNSVREAIKQLQAYGVLYIKRADGTYIEDSFKGKMLDPILYNLIFDNKDKEALAEMRSVIETGIIQSAMQNREITKIIPRLNELIAQTEEEFSKDEASPEKVLDIDLEFHNVIASTLENSQINILTDYITRMTVPSRMKAVEEWIRLGKESEFVRLHREMVEVIEKKDFSRINEVVNNHYVFLRKMLNPDKS